MLLKLKEGQELSIKWEVTKVTLMGIVSSEELDQERKWFSDKVFTITEDRNEVQRKN